jgi:hypothetical protein
MMELLKPGQIEMADSLDPSIDPIPDPEKPGFQLVPLCHLEDC